MQDDRRSSIDVPRMAFHLMVAALFVTAAVLKAHRRLNEGIQEVEILFALSNVLIFAELCFAAWLVLDIGNRRRIKNVAIATTFLAFGTYQFWLNSKGIESCGCLGYISLSPLVMAGIDMLVASLAILLARQPHPRPVDSGSDTGKQSLLQYAIVIVAVTVVVCFYIGRLQVPLPVASAESMRVSQRFLTSTPVMRIDESLVGSELPMELLLGDSFESKFREGRWIVGFVAPGCSKCKKISEQMRVYASSPEFSRDYDGVLLIAQSSTIGGVGDDQLIHAVVASDEFRWTFKPPVFFKVEDSIVSEVKNFQQL